MSLRQYDKERTVKYREHIGTCKLMRLIVAALMMEFIRREFKLGTRLVGPQCRLMSSYFRYPPVRMHQYLYINHTNPWHQEHLFDMPSLEYSG